MRLQQGQRMNPNRTTPWFPRYTNMDHLSNNPMAFEDDDWVVVHEKRHGTNFRMGYVKKENETILEKLSAFYHRTRERFGWTHDFHKARNSYLHVGSHNVIREYHPDDLYWKAALKVIINSWVWLPVDKVFFFEISGPGIQKGFDYGQEPEEFVVELIDIYDSKRERYLSLREVAMMASQCRMTEVPCLCIGEWRIVKDTYASYADGKATGADHIREGVVIKAHNYKQRKIFKFISPDYLIHQGKKKPEDETEWH
jgi:RNA ligase (TIGR02306 family)